MSLSVCFEGGLLNVAAIFASVSFFFFSGSVLVYPFSPKLYGF